MKMINVSIRLMLATLIMLSVSISLPVSAMGLAANQWQLVSFPRLPENSSIENVFAEAATDGSLTSIWTYNNQLQQWQSWPSQTGLTTSDLTELQVGQGYWVKTSANLQLNLTDASKVMGEMVLYPGWNLIGLSIDQAMGHEQAMAGVPFTELWKYDSNQNKFLAIQKSSGSQIILKEEFTDIEVGTGLWVKMDAQSTLLPKLGTLLPPDIDMEPLLNVTEYGIETQWVGFEVGVDVDWDEDGQYDFPNTQTVVAFGDFLNRQRLSITNDGNGVLSWQATISSGSDWLKFETSDENGNTQYVSQLSGSAAGVNSALTLFADRVGKASGSENNAIITITANGEVPEKIINVTMEVADIIGDYEINIDLATIDNKAADLHNPKYFLSIARDGTGIKAFLDEERSLLIPTTTYLSGSYAGDPASNFQILGQISQSADDAQNPFGKAIRRQITYVGRRSNGMDGLSPLDLKGEYYENIYGVFDDPIQLQGTFIGNRLSPIPAKQDIVNNAVRDNIIQANDTLLVDLDISQRLSITQVISKLEIDHELPEQLNISLTSPEGTTVLLHNNEATSVKKLSYDDTDISFDGLNLLEGQKSFGNWQLKIVNASSSVGELSNWQLDIYGAKVYQITGIIEPGVRLKLSGCGITRIETSGPDGSFVFDGLIPCDYEITVSQLGYEATATTVTILGCSTEAECKILTNYILPLTSEQLAALSPRFIPSSSSMRVIASPLRASLSKDPKDPLILNGLDVTDYDAMATTLLERNWQLFKRTNTTTKISEDGYLVETEYLADKVPYGKNFASYSEDFTKWNPNSHVNISASESKDPRGGYSAAFVEVQSQGSASIIKTDGIGEGGFSVKNGDYVTLSAFLKSGSTDEVRLSFGHSNGLLADEILNFTTGEHLGGTNKPSSIQTLANGWFRVSVTIEISADFNGFYGEIQLADNGTVSNTPSGTAFHIFGPQLEVHQQAVTLANDNTADTSTYPAEQYTGDYIPTGPIHTERSILNQQDVLISEGASDAQSWAHTLGNHRANAGVYYFKLSSDVKKSNNLNDTLLYTTKNIHINYVDTTSVHFGNYSTNAAAGSAGLSAMDSATFDINRPSVVDINPRKDSTNFTSAINPATETNVLEMAPGQEDTQVHDPAGNLNNHYRMFISTGQLYHTGSVYGSGQRLDIGIQSQEAAQ